MLRRIVGALAIALLAGCTNAPSTANPTTAPSPSAAASSPAPELKIPPEALLQQADVGEGEILQTVPGTTVQSPCFGQPPLPSDGMWTDRKTRDLSYRFTDAREAYTNRKIPNGYAQEVVLAYRPGGAKAYFKDLRDSLTRCATVPFDGGERWEQGILEEGLGGDESVLWRRLWRPAPTAKNQKTATTLVTVVRVREVVLLIEFHSMTGDGTINRAHVDRILKAAINRAAVLG
jgi:hypothetical protein